MAALRIAVCEDSESEQKHLLALIEETGIPALCTTFSCGEDFLSSFAPGKYDLIVMDIYMSGMSGVETVTELRRTDAETTVAFATTSPDHALEGYRLGVLKYIEKPVDLKSVRELLELAEMKKTTRPGLHLKTEGKEQIVPFEQILYVEQKGHDLLLYLTNDTTIRVPGMRLEMILTQFDSEDFYHCHKSYLVNLAYISSFNHELMVFKMKNGQNVHIRRETLGEARKIYENYLFCRARGLKNE